MADILDRLESDLRRAAAGRQYGDVRRLVSAFCEASAQEWKGLPPQDARARQAFERLQQMLEWTRVMLCTARACTAADLQRMAAVNRYIHTSFVSARQMHVDV